MSKQKVRQSNFELLRIVAIFGIIYHHLLVKGASTCGYINSYNILTDGCGGIIINSLIVGGVNCFVLITGWFGVRNLSKGFIKVLCETCFYGLISYLLVITIDNQDFSIKYLEKSIDFRNNWFVTSYMMLLLVSPIIEKSLENVTYKDLKNWLILLSIFNIVFVFLFGKLNNHGYNVLQFIYLYYIARFLRISRGRKWFDFFQKNALLFYILVSVLLFGGYLIICTFGYIPDSLIWFGYNQPLVIFSSLSVFAFFSSINIKSKFINIISKGVFGVFVLHTTKFMIPLRNMYAHQVFVEFGYTGLFFMAMIIFLICMLISIPGSKVTSMLTNLVYNSVLSQKVNK